MNVLTHFVILPHSVIPDALCNPPCHTFQSLMHFAIHFATLCNPTPNTLNNPLSPHFVIPFLLHFVIPDLVT